MTRPIPLPLEEQIILQGNATDRFSRSKILFGQYYEKIINSRVLLLGTGGVGGFVLDSLYRTGLKHITIVDKDCFDISNQNRQIGSERVGEPKVRVLEQMYEGVKGIQETLDENLIEVLGLNQQIIDYDYVVDAIDDIDAKILLAKACEKMPYGRYISSMGSGKRINPLNIRVGNIWATHGDKFARKFRLLLKKADFNGNFKVVFSIEHANCNLLGSFEGVTASFGLQIASEIIQDIIIRENRCVLQQQPQQAQTDI